MNIQILTITCGFIPLEVVQSVDSQDYPHYDWLIHYQKPLNLHLDPLINRIKNCAIHRTTLKNLALASKSEYFLWLDDDIVLPKHALSSLAIQTRYDNRILGGWYKTRDGRWVAGKWIADNVFAHFTSPAPSLILTDMVGLGCCLISRKALELLPNEDGCDLEISNPHGQKQLVGECCQFGTRAAENNILMYMVGDVVCRHLDR